MDLFDRIIDPDLGFMCRLRLPLRVAASSSSFRPQLLLLPAMPKSKRDKTGEPTRRAAQPLHTSFPPTPALPAGAACLPAAAVHVSPLLPLRRQPPTLTMSHVHAVSLTRTEKKGRQLKNKLIDDIRGSVDECVH